MSDAQCDDVSVVMYFDEERTLTESECSLVEEEECHLETVVREVEREVTQCGTVEETVCLNVMDTRYEEELKVDKTNMDPDTSIKAVFTSVEMKVKRKLENKENEEVTIVRKKMKVKINPTLDGGGGQILPPPRLLCSGAIIIDLRGPRFWYNSYFIVTM